MDKKFLFICGCARSGTTALRRLIVPHPKIVLGLERYVLLARKRNLIGPHLFTRERFFTLGPGETFYKNLDDNYYKIADRRFDDAVWIGDKIPGLYLDYDGIVANFASVDIIYIVRNIMDVAASYEKRATNANDKSWGEGRNYRQAVIEWGKSVELTLRMIEKNKPNCRIHIISYEDLFEEVVDLSPLFERLGLDMVSSVPKRYQLMLAKSEQIAEARRDPLSAVQRREVALTAPFESYRKLFDRRLVFSTGSLPLSEPKKPGPKKPGTKKEVESVAGGAP